MSLPAFMQKAANHGFVVEFWGSSSPSVVESEVGMETDSSTAQAHFASAAGLTEMHLTVTHTATNEKQEFSSLKVHAFVRGMFHVVLPLSLISVVSRTLLTRYFRRVSTTT